MKITKKFKIIATLLFTTIIIITSIYIFHDINSSKMAMNQKAEQSASIQTESTATSQTNTSTSNQIQSTDSSQIGSATSSLNSSTNESKLIDNKTSTTTLSKPKLQTASSKPIPSSTLQKPTPVSPISPSKKYIVGYYASWGPSVNYPPSSIDASKLTHINYAFGNVSSDNKLVLSNSSVDLPNFEGLRKLKLKNPSLKLLISVGGWGGSKYFSNAALTPESRETFANSCVNFIVTHGFDGVDLDWEFPVSGGIAGIINRPEDKQNFTKLIQAIRQKLNEQSKKDSKKYLLTIAGAPSTSYLKNIELTNILPYLDYIFIMGYDLHGPWDKYADFNAPLYNTQESSPQYSISVNDSVRNYLNAGAPASKLVMGMPFYGYKYTLITTNNNGLFQTFSKASSIGYNTIATTYLNNSAYTKFVHPQAKVPYLFGNNTFITYEDQNSILLKVQLAKNYGMAGVGAWELSHDSKGILLNSAFNTLY